MRLKVTTRNLFFRWAYLFTTQKTRDDMRTTTICALFWRSVLLTPITIIGMSIPVIVLGFTAARIGWVAVVLRIVGVVGAAAALCVVIAWVESRSYVRSLDRSLEARKPSWIKEAYRGIKDRYCPLLRVEKR